MEIYASEGSICDKWQFEFLLREFPEGCFVCKDAGEPVAFVTSIAHGRSGWIGNLIVRQDSRGRGIGKTLTTCAMEALRSAGVRTIWLAATEAGRWIYQKMGFVAVDTINQWIGFGRAGLTQRASMDLDSMLSLDLACWGDRREKLMGMVSEQGKVIACGNSFLVMQQWSCGMAQLGPWVGVDTPPELVEELLKAALAQIGPDTAVFSYVPFRNVVAAMLFAAYDFLIIESHTLMCLGSDAAYAPRHIFSLGSPALG